MQTTYYFVASHFERKMCCSRFTRHLPVAAQVQKEKLREIILAGSIQSLMSIVQFCTLLTFLFLPFIHHHLLLHYHKLLMFSQIIPGLVILCWNISDFLSFFSLWFFLTQGRSHISEKRCVITFKYDVWFPFPDLEYEHCTKWDFQH